MSLRIDHHVGIFSLAPLCIRGFSLGHHINLTMRFIPFGNRCNVNKNFPLCINGDYCSLCFTWCTCGRLHNI